MMRASHVDNEVRQHFGKPSDDKNYSPEFMEMVDVAFDSLDDEGFVNDGRFYRTVQNRNLGMDKADFYYELLKVKYTFFKREE